ncbi:MAG: cupin domain-containing protein [Gaiellaceae bacterium]
MKLRHILILGLVILCPFAGVALATPGSGATPSVPVRGTVEAPFKVKIVGLLKLKTTGPIDVADQTVSLVPGGHTGWHSHPGPALVVIKEGTFTLYDGNDPSCTPHVFEKGDAFVDRGGGHVHIGRNEGETNVELSVTYLLPVGAAPRTDVTPAPGNCPF